MQEIRAYAKEGTEPVLTWQQLKEFSNSLSNEELKQPVRYWGEDVGGKIWMVEKLKEDYYDFDGDGIVEASSLSKESLEEETKVYSKGDILLNSN